MQRIKLSKFNDLQDYASFFIIPLPHATFSEPTHQPSNYPNKNSPSDLQMKQESTTPQELTALKEMHEKHELKA